MRFPSSCILITQRKKGPLMFLSCLPHVSRFPRSPSQSDALSLVPGLPLYPCAPHKDSLTKARGTKTQEWEPIKGIIGAATKVVGGRMERKVRWKRRTDGKPGRDRTKKQDGRLRLEEKASGAKLDGLGEETVN